MTSSVPGKLRLGVTCECSGTLHPRVVGEAHQRCTLGIEPQTDAPLGLTSESRISFKANGCQPGVLGLCLAEGAGGNAFIVRSGVAGKNSLG